MKKGLFDKVVVIGENGQLGQELMKVFSDVKPRGFSREEIDLSKPMDIGAVLANFSPTLVINAAAMTNVDACQIKANQEPAMIINAIAPTLMARYCEDHHIPFVTYSSDYAVAGANKRKGLYFETDEPLPLENNYYARTKASMEEMVNRKGVYTVRTSFVFGNGKNFFKAVLENAKHGKSIRVVNDQFQCATYAVDLARQTRLMLEKDMPSGVYHVVNVGAYTLSDIARRVIEIAGIKCEVIPVTTKEYYKEATTAFASRPRRSVLVNTKLPPLRHLVEALMEYVGTL